MKTIEYIIAKGFIFSIQISAILLILDYIKLIAKIF